MQDRKSEGVLSTIGHTPLIQLNRYFEEAEFNVYGKMEFINPGGSMKDRVAKSMIDYAMKMGQINQDTTIIESSSGNMAVGLAQVCKYYDLKLICVVDSHISNQNIKILKTYGASIDMVSNDDVEKYGLLQTRLNRVNELLSLIKNSFWPCQYRNNQNPYTHCSTTMKEIHQALHKIDYLFCAVSTCGTLKGCLDYIDINHLDCKVYAVDAEGSVIFGGKSGIRLLPGHGASVEPYFSHNRMRDRIVKCIRVSDMDCVKGCRKLVQKEAILAGASTGGVLMAIEKVKEEIEPNSNCVVIFADRGERYLDTVYSEQWVTQNLMSLLVTNK